VAPPSKARPRVAYDLGRAGKTLPDDWHDDDEMAGAYELGVDDRDAAEAGSKRRHGPPAQRRAAESHTAEPTPPGDGKPASRRERDRADVASAAVPWSAHPLSKGDGGGLFLGIIGYCVGRAFLTEGPHGIWRWYAAKFTNKIQPKTSTTSSPAQPSSGMAA
jgi:hypothetical protein